MQADANLMPYLLKLPIVECLYFLSISSILLTRLLTYMVGESANWFAIIY